MRYKLLIKVLIGYICVITTITCALTISAKELPILVDLEEVQFYGDVRMVTIGTVEKVELKRGRMGSNYFSITLVKIKMNPFKAHHLTIIYPTNPFMRVNDLVLVQGIYKKEGREFGILQSNYIFPEKTLKGKIIKDLK